MKKALLAPFALVLLCIQSIHADPGPMTIWFTDPGVPNNTTSWQQHALPVGNGKLAAMVHGAVGTEHIQFNEDTIWNGEPHDYLNPGASPASLAALQTKCFNHQDIGGDAVGSLMAVPIREAAYQAPGSLVLSFPHSGTANYLRSLNLSNATVNVHYDYSGVTYNRDVFASAPSNRVIVVRLTASQAASINFTCSFATAQSASYSTSGNDLVMHASVSAIADSRYHATGLQNKIKYDARVRVIAEGGTVTPGGSSITVANADAVTLLLSVVSNFKSYDDLTADYVTICADNVAAAAALGYTALRQAQQDDYTELFDRVVLDLGSNAKVSQDIGYRKKQIAVDGDDPNLVALDFQLGRYLMISGSRPGSQPLNLQGKWNDTTSPSWDSKMTLNINQEMNYWGAEMCNLSECAEPLMDMVEDLAVTGHEVATQNYFSDGWVAHHNTDLWRCAMPVNGRDGIWPTGGAWLCQHVWWHYQYSGDTNWLATTGYPLMKSAAQFFQGYLVPHPTYGWMMTCPSYSPEHDHPGYDVANVPGPTMDNELIRDLFKHVIEASEILGVDASFRSDIATLRSQLPPDQVGRYGQLQEWLEDVDSNPDGHRHCSHLVGFQPGDEISPFYTPTTAAAAKTSVDFRGDVATQGGLTPWGMSVRINLQDRCQNGDRAYDNLIHTYKQSKVATNLVFADNHRQLDSMFGRLSGIAEMFLQSHSGDVNLLPALPSAFTNGMVSGLCARGGFQVDNLSWTNGQLAGATIISKVGNTCRLRSKWPIDIMLGTNLVSAPMTLPGLYEFSTVAGGSYSVIPANTAETENLSATTSGDAHTTVQNAGFSDWQAQQLSANAANDYVTYTVPNLSAGTYYIHVGADADSDRGRFQLSAGPSGGTLVNLGSVQDTYSPTNMTQLLPMSMTPPTTVSLWDNLLSEYSCGTLEVASGGDYDFKFTVDGKNAASSGYALVLDYIKITPTSGGTLNFSPTDVALSSSSVTENQPGGTVVGTLSTSDPNTNDTFTYTLVGGTGSADNGSFSISSNMLQTAASLDFETKSSCSIRVRTADQGGLYFDKTFIITVLNTNEMPTDIALSNATVAGNEPAGTTVGGFSTADPDSGDAFTYSLVGGAGSADNGSFTITNDTLYTAAVFDYLIKSSYSIRVRSTDSGSLYSEKEFTVTVTEPNLAPTDISLSSSTVVESQPAGTPVGNFGTADPNLGDTFTYTLVAGTGSTDNGSFSISGNTLQTAGMFDYETKPSYSIRVRSTDFGGLPFEKAFIITVTDGNDEPTAVALSNSTVAENQPSGSSVGDFSTTDPNVGDTFTYTLVTGTGSADNGSFSVSGNTLQTAASLDYETQSSYSIRVRSTDQGSLYFEEVVAITVTNVNDAPTAVIAAPNDGAAFTVGADITINATASDTDGTVSSVDFYRDLTLIGTDTSAPYSVIWSNAAVTNYALTVVATDDGSLQTTSAVVNVTVNLPNYSTTYQAEDALYGGGSEFETKNAGWHGTGYINFSSSGGYVEFSNVDGGGGGDATLTIRYALGNSTRTGLLIVNGASQSITFASLGSDWTVWSTNELTVSLGSGSTNTIRFESNGQDLANIDEIIVTTSGGDTNDAPTDISLSNSTLAENQPTGTALGTLSTTDPDVGDTFAYTLVSGTGSTDNGSFSIVGSTLQTAAMFDHETQSSFSVRVRSTDQGSLYFEEAFAITVTDISEAPAAPANVSPTNAEVVQTLTPALQASAFSDPDAGASHAASQWVVRRVTDSVTVFDSGIDTVNKTTLAVPSGVLGDGTNYNWQVRYEDNDSLWSAYSALTTFSTDVPYRPILAATAQDNAILLSWETNAVDFVLEYTTNDFPTTNWMSASPVPVTVGESHFVTNALDGDMRFYRLHKP